MWFIAVEVEQEMSAPPPNKNPGSAPGTGLKRQLKVLKSQSYLAGLKRKREGLTGLENENKP